MSLQADIKWIQSELSQVTDPELISAFKSLLTYRKKQVTRDWWDEISEDERAEINEGIRQADNGEVISHGEVKKSYNKWLSR